MGLRLSSFLHLVVVSVSVHGLTGGVPDVAYPISVGLLSWNGGVLGGFATPDTCGVVWGPLHDTGVRERLRLSLLACLAGGLLDGEVSVDSDWVTCCECGAECELVW